MELDLYFRQLDENTGRLLAAIKAAAVAETPGQAGERWTPLQVAEHILLTEQLVQALLSRPAESAHNSHEVLGDEKLRRLMVEMRGRKAKAPPSLEPNGKYATPHILEQAFLESRNKLKQNLKSGILPVTNALYRHPLLGEMTVSDWLHFLLHHSERHILQMQEYLAG